MSTKHRGRFKGEPVTYRLPTPAGGVRLETFVPWTLVKRGAKKAMREIEKRLERKPGLESWFIRIVPQPQMG